MHYLSVMSEDDHKKMVDIYRYSDEVDNTVLSELEATQKMISGVSMSFQENLDWGSCIFEATVLEGSNGHYLVNLQVVSDEIASLFNKDRILSYSAYESSL